MSRKNEGVIQFLKFAAVGIVNTAVDWIFYYILINTFLTRDSDKSVAKAISFVIAVINSFILNSNWTFRQEYHNTTEGGKRISKSVVFIRFFVVSLIGWGINYLAFKLAIGYIPKPDVIALIFASGSAVVWNFIANKLWTY